MTIHKDFNPRSRLVSEEVISVVNFSISNGFNKRFKIHFPPSSSTIYDSVEVWKTYLLVCCVIKPFYVPSWFFSIWLVLMMMKEAPKMNRECDNDMLKKWRQPLCCKYKMFIVPMRRRCWNPREHLSLL